MAYPELVLSLFGFPVRVLPDLRIDPWQRLASENDITQLFRDHEGRGA